MIALADRCLADYDENGWRDPAWLNPDDVAHHGVTGTAAE
jgi:4-hydroxyphenylacetate 3-monooxygenase